jgi:hypothetical protein
MKSYISRKLPLATRTMGQKPVWDLALMVGRREGPSPSMGERL